MSYDFLAYSVHQLYLLCFQIRQKLLAWYDNNHRVLPWRRNAHSLRQPNADDKYSSVAMEMPQQQFAYCVWVCEVMSQQTQVPRVAEYFTRWIKQWPTVQVGTVSRYKQIIIKPHHPGNKYVVK